MASFLQNYVLSSVIPAVIGAIAVFVCIVVLIKLIRKKSMKFKVHKHIIYLTYGSVGCFCISMALFTVCNVIGMLPQTKNTSDWIIWIFTLTIINGYLLFYIISQIFIYWLLFFRAYLAFSGTKYAVSKLIYIIFSISLMLFFVSGIMGGIANFFLYYSNSYNDSYFEFASLYAFGTEFTDFFITSFLVVLVIKKLLIG
eukprot:UN03921